MTTVSSKLASVADRLAGIEQARRDALAKLETEMQILSELPADLQAPTISNEGMKFFGKAGAWLSFRGMQRYSTDAEGVKASDIFEALERGGYEPLEPSLVQWDNYRRAVEPLACEELPGNKYEGRMGYTLKDCDPIAPLWLEANQHTGPEARAFYRSPSGLVLKLAVSAGVPLSITAERESIGRHDWRFKPGSARVLFPQDWHAIRTSDGESVATISHHTRGHVTTDQGIDGVVYFQPNVSPFPLSPAALMRVLETSR